MRAIRLLSCCLAAVASVGEFASAQAPAPPAPVVTVWQRLGIPQGLDRLNAGLINRRGNFPGLEKKPPLMRIADPANLSSSNPAIKKAAEVKMQEDMAKQKIKAIKYLADLGCDDCYPGITEALIAALDDCTEKVRYEAAKAIRKSVEDNCTTCNKACCCKEEMTKKLAEVAFEMDDECCFKERSERVREEAAAALRVCCPNCLPEGLPIEAPLEVVPVQPPVEGPPPAPPVEGPISPTPAEEIVPPPPPASPTAQLQLTSEDEGVVLMLDSPSGAHTVEITDEPHGASIVDESELGTFPITADDSQAMTPVRRSRRIAGPPEPSLVSYRMPSDEMPVDRNALAGQAPVLMVAQPISEPMAEAAPARQAPMRSAAPRGARGRVERVDLSTQSVQLHFADGMAPRVGSRVAVFHEYLLETAELGELSVVDVRDGVATARVVGHTPLQKISKGDSVIVR